LSGASYSAIELGLDNDRIFVLDQLALPVDETYREYGDCAGAAEAIRDMVVRGAPAIGITAAYGMVLAARAFSGLGADDYQKAMARAGEQLEATRPTAVNLSWAVACCLRRAASHAEQTGSDRHADMAELARQIHRDDVAACKTMGRHGAARLQDGMTVLTHCNAGALATGGYGSALGVIRGAVETGKKIRVLASETRPYLQGARLTAWELHRDGIDVTVITDNMVGHCMQLGKIDAVVVGADRIAANGDVANKIGTYSHACLARAHERPFYVAAPWSTVDAATAHGEEICIEQREREQIARVGGRQLLPDGVAVYNPAFDVTPAGLVTAIFTERGEHDPGDLPLGQ